MYKVSYSLLLTAFVSVTSFAQMKTTETRMTKDTLINGVTTSVTTTISESEDITPRNNMLAVSPVKYILFYNMTYYRKFSDMFVLGVGLSAPTFGGKIADEVSISGFGANLEGRFYLNGTAPSGFYLAPNVFYNTLSITDGGDDKVLWTTVGLMAGFQFFPTKNFSIGTGVGFDYFMPSATSNGETVTTFDQFARVLPAIRFELGYSW